MLHHRLNVHPDLTQRSFFELLHRESWAHEYTILYITLLCMGLPYQINKPYRPTSCSKQMLDIFLTSLLRRLQAQTLPNEAPPIGKIQPFIKMAVTFEPRMGFWCPLVFRKFKITITLSISLPEVLSLTVWAWRRRKSVGGKGWLNQFMN